MATRRPTDAELEILRVLWELGPTTVRGVYEHLGDDRSHTTVLKLMQIMVDKGLLTRDEGVRPQLYAASTTQRRTQKQLVGDLLDRAFGGAPGHLVVQALASRRSTPEERARIRELLDRLEQEDAS